MSIDRPRPSRYSQLDSCIPEGLVHALMQRCPLPMHACTSAHRFPAGNSMVGALTSLHATPATVNPSSLANSANSACARIVRVRCRSGTVRSRIFQLADRHQYACTHIKFIKIRSFERACGPAEVGYSEQSARIRCISMRPTVSLRARIWACAVKPDLLEHVS